MDKKGNETLVLIGITILVIVVALVFTGLGSVYKNINLELVDKGEYYECYKGQNIDCVDYSATGEGSFYCVFPKDGYNNCYAEYTVLARKYVGNDNFEELGIENRKSIFYTDGECRLLVSNDILKNAKIAYAGIGSDAKDVFKDCFGTDEPVDIPTKPPTENGCNLLCRFLAWLNTILNKIGINIS